ncbi:MAG TPA: hypothetical protein VGM88_23210 [Kofleriaceae bacterium]|jgi:hypothetical protein
MSSVTNKYFDTPAQAPEHPRIRAWSSWMTSAARTELELRRLPHRPARMYVTFFAVDGKIARQDDTEWDIELDSWLQKHHVRARDAENETLRFVLRFKAAFRPIAIRYGDGFFNSVIVHQLRGGPFGGEHPLSDVLGAIHEYEAGGGSKIDCEEQIDFEITIAAQALLALYDNDRDTVERILVGALAQYLDERFRVSERRESGFG